MKRKRHGGRVKFKPQKEVLNPISPCPLQASKRGNQSRCPDVPYKPQKEVLNPHVPYHPLSQTQTCKTLDQTDPIQMHGQNHQWK